MFNNLWARYYRKKQRKATKKTLQRYENISEEEKNGKATIC